MKSFQQIKKELHEYIDRINDEKKIMELYENTLKHLKSDPQNYETDEHITAAADGKDVSFVSKDQGYQEETESNKESRKAIARWFSDGGKNSC